MDWVAFRGSWNFSHWLIMGRSWNWPDLRSQISKIRDIHFVDTIALINSWNFYIDHSTVVALVQVQTFGEVGSLKVTWWPDLGSHGANFLAQYAEMMREQVCKIWRRCAPNFPAFPAALRVFPLSAKNLRGGGGRKTAPPPARRGLKRCRFLGSKDFLERV